MANGMVAPQTGIALLRVVVGGWFLKAVWTKLTLGLLWGVVPYPAVSSRFLNFYPRRIAEFAAGNPIGWYKAFLQETVLPHTELFASLQAYAEACVGVGLVLGLGTRLAALVGLFLSLTYGLAVQWMSFGQQGLHVVLVPSMVVFLGTRAGRAWGLDGVLLRAAPKSRLLRLLI